MHVRYNYSVDEHIEGRLATTEVLKLDDSGTHFLDVNKTMYLGRGHYKLPLVELLHLGFV